MGIFERIVAAIHGRHWVHKGEMATHLTYLSATLASSLFSYWRALSLVRRGNNEPVRCILSNTGSSGTHLYLPV